MANSDFKDPFTRDSVVMPELASKNKDCYVDPVDSTSREIREDAEGDMTCQVYIFLLQMKLLNTLDLIRAVCRPWGISPHSNDYVYHFNQIACTKNLKLLHRYESTFGVIYELFERLGGNNPANLWTHVRDIDYFRIVYQLECIRLNLPFDNGKYLELLEQTISNIDRQPISEEPSGDSWSNDNELPPIGKYNWQSRTHSYSLVRMGDALRDDDTVVPSDGEIDLSCALASEDTIEDLSCMDSDLINTCNHFIELGDKYGQVLYTDIDDNHPGDGSEGEHSVDGQTGENFNRLVLDVLGKRTSVVVKSREPEGATLSRKRSYNDLNYEMIPKRQRRKKNPKPLSTSLSHHSYHTNSHAHHRQQEQALSMHHSSHAQKHNSTQLHPQQQNHHQHHSMVISNDLAIPRPGVYSVVSASVSYDKRQQRFMAQWKTREGTKHSKSFYAKRYASPLLARKHAELYKLYVLQHRGNYVPGDISEPTYEQLAAQNFEPLETINITDVGFLEEFETPAT